MSSHLSYCVKCRTKTANVDPHVEVMIVKGHPRRMLKSTCVVCGSKKSEFVSSGPKCVPKGVPAPSGTPAKKGKGFFGKALGGFAGSALGSFLPF
jgi:hypothetical protein